MDYPLFFLAIVLALGLFLAAAGFALLRRLKARYRDLFQAVATVHEQVCRTQAQVEKVRQQVEEASQRLAKVDPQLDQLQRSMLLEQLLARLDQGESEGRLAPETARRLRAHLLDSLEESLAFETRPRMEPREDP